MILYLASVATLGAVTSAIRCWVAVVEHRERRRQGPIRMTERTSP